VAASAELAHAIQLTLDRVEESALLSWRQELGKMHVKYTLLQHQVERNGLACIFFPLLRPTED
jgi:hypothetical protein